MNVAEMEREDKKARHLTLGAIATTALVIAIIALLLRGCDLGSETSDRRLRDCIAALQDIDQGATGATGQDGADGEDGATGEPGADGEDGTDGATGEPGEDGTDGATGEPGEDGTDGATGPQGEPGETGATGPQGEQGIPGEQGLEGVAAECGLSAYELWLALGNEGTEQDFLDSLVGATGATGPQGEPGSAGTIGLGDSGSFWDTTTQGGPGVYTAGTAYPMLLNSADTVNNQGVSISNGSQFTFTNPGVYNLAFSAQFTRLQGGTVNFVSIWLRKNGVNVPDTATDITLISNGTRYVAAWNFFIPVTCDTDGCDQYQLMWTTDTDQTEMIYVPADGVRPAIPSLIATVNQVK